MDGANSVSCHCSKRHARQHWYWSCKTLNNLQWRALNDQFMQYQCKTITVRRRSGRDCFYGGKKTEHQSSPLLQDTDVSVLSWKCNTLHPRSHTFWDYCDQARITSLTPTARGASRLLFSKLGWNSLKAKAPLFFFTLSPLCSFDRSLTLWLRLQKFSNVKIMIMVETNYINICSKLTKLNR